MHVCVSLSLEHVTGIMQFDLIEPVFVRTLGAFDALRAEFLAVGIALTMQITDWNLGQCRRHGCCWVTNSETSGFFLACRRVRCINGTADMQSIRSSLCRRACNVWA